jgi:hypothetical protein
MALEYYPVFTEMAKYKLHGETMKPISELKGFLVYKTWNKLLYVAWNNLVTKKKYVFYVSIASTTNHPSRTLHYVFYVSIASTTNHPSRTLHIPKRE